MNFGRATIADVARLAGVSKATVSRFLNHRDTLLSRDIATRVETAVKSLGYVPSPMAQALKRGRSKLIGLVVADITNPFSVAVLRGALVDLAQVPARSGKHRLITRRLRPIVRIGRHRLGFDAMQRTPDAADKTEAIGADTACARLVMVGRPKPAPGFGDDVVARVRHGEVVPIPPEPPGRGMLPGSATAVTKSFPGICGKPR